MHVYVQKTGKLFRDGWVVGEGYSGHLDGWNNPQMQDIHSVGPIPRGRWRICGPPTDTAEHGPFVLRLDPQPGTETFGRSGFLMHGDAVAVAQRGQASLGCIIQPRIVREGVWGSGDYDLTVVSDDTDVPQAC